MTGLELAEQLRVDAAEVGRRFHPAQVWRLLSLLQYYDESQVLATYRWWLKRGEALEGRPLDPQDLYVRHRFWHRMASPAQLVWR